MQSELPVDDTQPKKAAAVHDRMLAFTFTQGKYWIFNGKEGDDELKWDSLKDKAWVVLNKVSNNKQTQIVKNGAYKLHNGDIVRFGRVVFKLTIVQNNHKGKKPECEELFDLVDKQIPTNRHPMNWESTKTVMPDNNFPAQPKKSTFTAKDGRKRKGSVSEGSVVSEESEKDGETVKNEKSCRICYGEEEDEIEDPLIEPCNCTGSVSYIHLSCAKAWINEELTQDITNDVKSYCWERISCELCNSNFKEIIYKDGRQIKLFEKEKIEAETYIVLESIYPEYIKIYFGLIVEKGVQQKEFMLGRSRNCNIKLNLDSISRTHSKIMYDCGNFYMKDCGSTFGTLVLLRQPLIFSKKKKHEVAIQSGPTLIEIKHGGKKKIEHTYASKDGQQKKCAVYSEFKHKIPTVMRNFIDRHTDCLEVIRADQYRKPQSVKNINDKALEFNRDQIKYLSNNNIMVKNSSDECKMTAAYSSNKLVEEEKNNYSKNHLAVPRDCRLLNLPSVSEKSKLSKFDSINSPSASPNFESDESSENPSQVLHEINSSAEEEKGDTQIERRDKANVFERDVMNKDDEDWSVESPMNHNELATLPAENRARVRQQA